MNIKTKKKRLAVSISLVWAIRNIVYSGLLEKLIAEFDVYVVFRKPAPEVEDVCRRMGAQVWVAPQVKTAGTYRAVYQRIANWLTQAHKLRHDLHSEAMKKSVARRDLSWKQRAYLKLRDGFLALAGKSFIYELMIHVERWLYYRSHELGEFLSFLSSNQIELFLFTAPFQSDGDEVHLMRACKTLGVRTVAMVLGFDNLTTKGRLPEFLDHYFVWNEIMKSEVPRIYPNIDPAQVFVTGSSQFDFYAMQNWGYTREVFCQKVGLDPGKPIVLYAANGETLVPYEERLVKDLIIRAQNHPSLAGIQFLIRLHPFDTSLERWKDVQAMKNVVVVFPWQAEKGGAWGLIGEDDLHILVSSLKHSFCNVNVSSTMALDSIFCDRPVIGPAYSLGPELELSVYVRKLYDREHFAPITYSGAMTLASSPEELMAALCATLNNPEINQLERNRLTSKMLGKPLGSAGWEISNCLMELSRNE